MAIFMTNGGNGMAKYTIEDIEILRQKSGISYEEAVNLLEYHNGSLARALVDLEKNGRLKNDPGDSKAHKGAKGLFQTLYSLRLKVKKGDVTIINLSSLFMLLSLAIAPHLCVVGLILALLLGYRFSVERGSKAFVSDTFDDIVKNAKSNVQNTVNSFTQQFVRESEEKPQPDAQPTQPRSESAPSGTRPVSASFTDQGSVDVHDGGDGYHEADIR